ncbi:MAG: transglycosylase SLT domain-containing protein [bacterium]|nr:transglycosylase SLT domain-containing protein [bacterium]
MTSAALVLLYACALQRFNPHLDGTRAALYAQTTIREADREGLDARLLVALIAVESSWNDAAISPAGARGLGQLMPGTADALGVDPDDPQANIHGVAVHLRGLLARYAALAPAERYADALAAYNAGAGAVERYGGVPPYPETRAYVRRVIALWRRLSGA